MTKNEIKLALDLAGVTYAKKANLETLQALFDALPAQPGTEDTTSIQALVEQAGETLGSNLTSATDTTDPTMPMGENGNELVDALPTDEQVDAALVDQGDVPALDYATATADQVADSNCPHCGTHLSNGLLHVTDEIANGSGETYFSIQDPAFLAGEWNCMACGGHFGPPPVYEVATETGNGLKIEKDRPEQNGIKRPSIGGKCRAIWDALDAYRAETGELPTSKTVRELAADEGWNPNNASIEYYQWRKYNGIQKGA